MASQEYIPMASRQSRDTGWWFATALGLVSVIAAADALTPTWADFIILVISGPLFASARNTPRRTLVVAGYALALTLAVEISHEPAVPQADLLARSLGVLLAGLLASLAASYRQRVEDALGESEARFRMMADTAPVLIWVSGPDGLCTFFNKPWLEFTGRRLEQELGDGWADGLHPEDRGRCLATYRAAVGDRRRFQVTCRLRRADGEERWVLATGVPRFGDGDFLGHIGSGIDITDQRRVEEDLRAAQDKYRGLFENAVFGVFRSTPDGRILEANPMLARLLGYESPEELIASVDDVGRQVYLSPAQRAEFVSLMLEQRSATESEIQFRRKDGSVGWFSISARVVRNDDGSVRCFEGMMEDIGERKRLEEQLRLSQKIEAVGRLAGGVAHDFNNLLTAIGGYCDLLLRGLRPGDPSRRHLDEIRKAGERASALTRQLLAFSRKQILVPQVLELGAVVGDLETMLRRLVGEDIAIHTVVPPGAGRVRADPGQVEQVIMNLAVNARDAMPGGGRLTIEVGAASLDATFARENPGARPGAHVMLAVADDGTGMDDEVKKHLFEPFFTTKEQGKGTGLGLATVYGIVKQSGGYVSVESELGRGSTVRVYLPRVEEAAEPKPPAPGAPPPGGPEVILLVEDEAAVRGLLTEVLEESGYRVLAAKDGPEALRVSQAHAGVIQLALSDMVMPGMSGRELIEGLLVTRPLTRVLYMSGYTDDAVVRRGLFDGEAAFIQKPFSPDALLAKVREILDATPA